MDDFDEKYEELVEKVRLLEEKLEELEEAEEEDPGLIDAGSCQVTLENTQFSAHWVSPEDAKSFEDCDAITNTRDAQKLFKEASAFRDASDKHRSVEHGDLMVLTCNRGEEIPIIVDGVEVVDTAAERETNACYFVGMCIRPDGSFQEECPASSDVTNKQNPCGDSEDPDAETFKEFIAWDTCGGSTNYAFQEPDFESDLLCKGSLYEDGTPEVVGVKLKLEERENMPEDMKPLDAFVPLVEACPVTEKIEFKELLDPNDYGSYVEYGAADDYGNRQITITLPIRKRSLSFKGGLLVESVENEQENLQLMFSDKTGEDTYLNWKEIQICEEGEEKCIKVPYKACDDG